MTRKARQTFVLLALIVVSSAARDARANGPAEAITTPTVRVVSLAPNLTETMFALGLGDRLVGVTDFCRFPAEARSKPSVGGLYNLSKERVLALRPSVVLMVPAGELHRAGLENSGIEVVAVPSESLADVLALVPALGRRFGAEERGRALAEAMRRDLDAVAARCSGLPRKRVLIVVGYAPGTLRDMYGAGPGTYLGDLIQLVGAENVLAGAKATYPLVSRETLLSRRPDVILDANRHDSPTPEERQAILAAWRRYFGGPSVTPRIVLFDDPRFMIPGPDVARTAEALAKDIHGDL